MQLCEQYRPRSWSEVVGQDKALAKIANLRERGLGGRAYWISGQPGTGKTTIALLLASEVADDWNTEQIDAGDLTAERVRQFDRLRYARALGTKSGYAIIVNEAHGLRADIVRRLLCLLEPIPEHLIFIFTTTVEGQASLFEGIADTSPLLSRCSVLELSRRDLAKPFAERAATIETTEGRTTKPPEFYIKLARKHNNNLRAMLQELDETR